MSIKINTQQFKIEKNNDFEISKANTKVKKNYSSDIEYEAFSLDYKNQIDELQSKMYAHNRYGLILIFQAMDAAGKDGTIKHVISGVNPHGIRIENFKRPSENELDHDFLWRSNLLTPKRGTITIFNRSYYEEVLVAKVHPEIVTKFQKIPNEQIQNMNDLWEDRYKDISNLEKYLHRNGIHVLKFFLNISKKEQGERLIERINDPTKNWKFEEGDIKERGFWNDYMAAYEDAINQTSSENSPWYIVPADDKKNMRLIVSQIILEKLQSLDIYYPKPNPERTKILEGLIQTIKDQDKE